MGEYENLRRLAEYAAEQDDEAVPTVKMECLFARALLAALDAYSYLQAFPRGRCGCGVCLHCRYEQKLAALDREAK